MDDTIEKRHSRFLPHWSRPGAIYTVTLRLADSLPQSVLLALQEERELRYSKKQEQHQPLPPLSEKMEQYLDAGYGTCFLRTETIASLVKNAIHHFETERYRLFAWCIMPNHVHAILQPHNDWKLHSILHSWKSFTAQHANKILKRSGSFWQEESYDHMIRSETELYRTISYVWHNPEQAGLQDWRWRWKVLEEELYALLAAWDTLR